MGKQNFGVICPADAIDDLAVLNAVHGGFPGSAVPAARIEALVAAHVPRPYFKDLADVYGSKWWDYRRTAPGHCFMLFVHHYHRQFRFIQQIGSDVRLFLQQFAICCFAPGKIDLNRQVDGRLRSN